MLELPGQPLLDKAALVGACVRLKFRPDLETLRRECAALPREAWSGSGRSARHRMTESVFLRGFAPAEGERPIEDRDALAAMPATRALIHEQLGGTPQRCLLARLAPGGTIDPHLDRPPYFWQTLRLHLALHTNAATWMYCGGYRYHFAAGEVWALNNSTLHAVANEDSAQWRTHLICDLLPGPALLAALRDGERALGERDARFDGELRALATA